MENEIALAKEEYAALKGFARPVRSPEGFMVLIDPVCSSMRSRLIIRAYYRFNKLNALDALVIDNP